LNVLSRCSRGNLQGVGQNWGRFLKGREDDEVLSTVVDNSVKVERYVVPSRRQWYTKHAEVKPTFRTPWSYIMVGQIAIYLFLS
jgi:hypothetical protein